MVGEKLIMSSKSIDLKLLEVENAQSQNLVEILLWVGKPPIDHHGWSPPIKKTPFWKLVEQLVAKSQLVEQFTLAHDAMVSSISTTVDLWQLHHCPEQLQSTKWLLLYLYNRQLRAHFVPKYDLLFHEDMIILATTRRISSLDQRLPPRS